MPGQLKTVLLALGLPLLLSACALPREAALQLEIAQLKAQMKQQRDVELVRQLRQQSGLSEQEFYAQMQQRVSAETGPMPYLRQVITAAEVSRANGKPLAAQAVSCATLVPLPPTLKMCKIRQDEKATYLYAQDSAGQFFGFDGSVLKPVDAPPPGF